MRSPVFPDVTMVLREIEPRLEVYECPKSGGMWVPLQAYLSWKDGQSADVGAPPLGGAPVLEDDSKHRVLVCPESGRLLLRYRVGQGLPFHVDRSPVTGGVWLDKGEWEALKSRGLHVALHLIFTSAYQRQVRTAEFDQRLTESFGERIGAADFAKVEAFGAWLASHPKRRDICCYLFEFGKPEPGAGER